MASLPSPMDPIPISSYAINLILQYISPPSQLASPIPSNLISRSLLHRHAFLEISPEDPSSYLSWPSPGRDRAIQLLESLPMPLDDEVASDFLIGYAVDPEHAYAHVHVKPTGDDGLRLVFEWDGEESWRYHDSNTMPFPPGTQPSLGDAVSGGPSVSDPVPESGGEKLDKAGKSDANGDQDDDNDDSYWNSYGVEADSDAQLLSSTSKNETDTSEDAYWAQYASVHGTADSTVPSPVQKKARRLEAGPDTHYTHREVFIPALNGDIRSPLRDPKAPASPTVLAHRLAALSPRYSNASPLSASLPEPNPEEDIPGATDDDTESPSTLLDDETSWGWGSLQRNRQERTVRSTVTTDTAQGANQDADGRAIQDAVRGLFWLWKTRKEPNPSPRGKEQNSTEELDRVAFLQLVSGAISG